ncbi:hypothetical protein [Phocaeicola coprophilus]|uniref:hypothetical protein n=1 Tax=Phocaeicola coprophilus TaxID=387090 RepID=UPI001D807413|nr:hypothetical protein [Phocaeicola coprophilus]HJE47788.1 tail fiber domain-containing protein [Phocaeicola coprophilus]
MKIVDIKTKIIPSNPRSKNYPIGYPGGIASNSNGVTPDLSIYLLKEIWERNFEERTDEYGNEYLYIRKPLAIGGGATMYASNGVVVPSIFDGLPLDNTTIRKNPETGLIEVIGGTGTSFDENAMWSALSGSSDNQINKSHLTTALDGYATQNWVIENYATKSELSAVSNKLNDFLEGSDTDEIINKWKELEAFLSGMSETDNLAEILKTKADRSYVDSTFVTLATKQTITGEKTFSSVLNTAAIKASGAITAPSLAVSDWVTIAGIKLRKLEDGALMLEGNLALTGALTMYASNGQSFDTIYDGLPIDNDTIYWQEVDGSRVLKAREGSGSSFDKSAMWAALEGATTEQINKTHLTTALNGYATESWVTSKNYLTSVSIATISDLHANWDALLKAAPSAYVTRWPTISEVTDRKNLIIKLNGGSTEGTNLFTYNVTGEKTINITPAGIGAAASSHNHSWSNITSGKPSTLSGYGITDAYTKTESDNKYPTKTGSGASGTWGISITGNAGSSTKLQTAQKIWGQLFDGTKPVTGALTSVTDITGTGTFTGANLKATDSVYVNGIRLHKTSDGVITLEGNLAVTGGITTYAIDPVSASTVMDGVVVDGTTIKKENGKLVAVGGGEAGSVAWGNISGKPSVFPTNIANITDLHSSWDSVLAAQKPAWLTAVSIATISDLHANWDALLKAAPSAYVTRWPTISEVTNKQNLIVKLNGGTTEGTNQFTYNATAAKTINITASSVGAAASSHNHSWSNITSGKPTTLAGYGITDGVNSVSVTGSGNAITSASISGHSLTLTKGSTFLLSSQYTAADVLAKLKTVDGAGSDLEADILALTGETGSMTGTNMPAHVGMQVFQYYQSGNGPTDYGNFLRIRGNGGGCGELFLGWAPSNNTSNIWYKSKRDTGSWGSWRQVAFTDMNVASATRLQTARNIWGISFDGTKDVTGNITLGDYDIIGYNGARIIQNLSGNLGINPNGNVGIGTTTPGYKLDVNGNAIIRSTLRISGQESSDIYTQHNNNGNITNISSDGFTGVRTSIVFQWYNTKWEIGNTRDGSVGSRGFAIYKDKTAAILINTGQTTIYGNLLATGGSTFYGSDIRYKSIIQSVPLLSLNKIAKAPSFVYHWNKKGMKCDRLNLGGSAQYTQSVLPWAVEDNDNFLSMDYATVAYTFAVHTARHLLTYETRTDKKIKKLEREIVILKKQLKKLGYEEVRTLDDSGI